MQKRVAIAVSLLLAWGSTQVYADDNTYDPRSLGMGGTGVTTSNMDNAAFKNPAMLASSIDGTFTWELPIIAGRLQDQTQLNSDLNTMGTDADNLTNALTAFDNAVTANNLALAQSTAGKAATALSTFNTDMANASNRSLLGDGFVGTMMAFPSNNFALALYVDARAQAGAFFNYSSADQTTINNFIAALQTCSTASTIAGCSGAQSLQSGGQVNNLTSTVDVRGLLTKELGISIAHHYDSLGGLDVGITPKVQQLTTYDYQILAQSNNNISLNQGEKKYSAFNADLGVVKQVNDNVKAGLVVKNMISKSFKTVLGNNIDIKPQATVGMSYKTDLTTTGIDLDVVSNKPVIPGYSKTSQYVRIGTELDAAGWAQLRLGFRHDLKGNYPNLPSVGLALSPFGLHIDLSAAYANKQEAAASFQLGFNW